MKYCHIDNISLSPWGYYAKWSKSDGREKDKKTLWFHSYVEYKTKKVANKQTKQNS